MHPALPTVLLSPLCCPRPHGASDSTRLLLHTGASRVSSSGVPALSPGVCGISEWHCHPSPCHMWGRACHVGLVGVRCIKGQSDSRCPLPHRVGGGGVQRRGSSQRRGRAGQGQHGHLRSEVRWSRPALCELSPKRGKAGFVGFFPAY